MTSRSTRLLLLIGLLAGPAFLPLFIIRATRAAASPTVFIPLVHAVRSTTGPCAEYPTRRVPIEGQSWWRDAGEDFFMQEHIHVSACVPIDQTISGVLPVDITVKLHNNAVGIWLVGADSRQASTQGTPDCLEVLACIRYSSPRTCAATDCEFKARLDIPTEKISYDGIQPIQVFALAIRADGHETRAGFEFPVTLGNGAPVQDFPMSEGGGMLQGFGWHTATDYSLVLSGEAPKAAVSGIWQPQLISAGLGAPTTEYEVLIDPNIHEQKRGIVVAEGSGSTFENVQIDTTKLANGPHKLFVRAGSQVDMGTNSAIMVLPFTVQN